MIYLPSHSDSTLQDSNLHVYITPRMNKILLVVLVLYCYRYSPVYRYEKMYAMSVSSRLMKYEDLLLLVEKVVDTFALSHDALTPMKTAVRWQFGISIIIILPYEMGATPGCVFYQKMSVDWSVMPFLALLLTNTSAVSLVT